MQQNLVHQLQAALKAKELYKRDKDYIIQHGEVKIVDEFTGRILEGRRWSEGLHQAVEAKEGVKIKEENQTLATITLQNYFRMYDKLAGMTGTAATEAAELDEHLRPAGRADPDQPPDGPRRPGRPHLQDRGRQVRRRRRRHRRALRDRPAGARRHDLGREVREAVRAARRSAASPTRCSTPSSTPGRPRSSPRPAGSARSPWPPTWPVAASTSSSAATPRAWPSATCAAEGLDPETDEGQARYDELLERSTRSSAKAEGDKVRELGGLYVLGTERHESRRIDNQLRGRSGRQGDPGESRFYLSLEDELMRLFATGAMSWVMGKALPDDVPIEAKMVTKAIERAQNTVEQRNAEIRKNVLKYDEVMNEQRKVIYKRRDQILDGADLRDEALEYLADAVDATIEHATAWPTFAEEWDLEGLARRARRRSGPPTLTVEQLARVPAAPTRSTTLAHGARPPAYYERREEELGADVDARGRAPGDAAASSTSGGASTSTRWTTSRRASTCGPWARRTRSSSGSARASRCSAQMMHGIAQDFVRYVMHVQVGAAAAAERRPHRPCSTCRRTPARGRTTTALQAAAQQAAAAGELARRGDGAAARPAAARPPSAAHDAATVVKAEWDKTPRNAPCPCGSGKKFKLCHGR